MTTYSFPAASFAIDGDAEAVRDTGSSYGRFATTAGEAAADIRSLDSGSWVGTEGDIFRTQVADIPPHLDTAHSAFGQVARALDSFADVLASAQRQMGGVCADAEQTFRSLAGARADRAELREPTADQAAADPAAHGVYDERRQSLDGRIGRLEATWGDQLAAAAGLRDRVAEAARQTAATIRAAGRTSPTADQNWFQDRWEKGKRWTSDRLDDLKGFVAEHAEAFRGLAKVLRVVGVALVVVGAVLAVLGVGAAVMTVGFALWGAGDALDATVDWAEGKLSGRQLLFRAGLAVVTSVAGGVVAKVGAEAMQRLAPRLRRWLSSRGAGDAADAAGSAGEPPRFVVDGNGTVTDVVPVNATQAVLNEHAEAAARRLQAQGLTRRQAARAATDPDMRSMFEGERLDTFMRASVEADPRLAHLESTPRGTFGPDFVDRAADQWYDLTTPGEWRDHVRKYGPGGIPVFWK
jgi:hypothetical protein